MVNIPDFLVSESDADLFEFLKEQLAAQTRGTLALVGSGLSQECGYASWGELVDRICESAELAPSTADGSPQNRDNKLLNRLSQARARYGSRHVSTADAHWTQDVAKFLSQDRRQGFSDCHVSLVGVNFSAILTTNYDNALVLGAEKANLPLRCYSYEPRATLGIHLDGPRCLYFLHGRLWGSEGQLTGSQLVIVRDDYDLAYGDGNGPVASLLKQVLPNHNVVLVGFGMQDPDLTELLRRCAQDDAFKKLIEERRDPRHPSRAGPWWFRLDGLPDDDKASALQSQINRGSGSEFFSLIHYKYSPADVAKRWGLVELLRELADCCPLRPTSTAVSTEAGATTEAPLAAETPAVEPSIPTRRGTEGVGRPAAQTRDFNELLNDVEGVLRKGHEAEESTPTTPGVEWLLGQLSDSSVRAFVAKVLEDDPTLLEQWFPVLLAARLLTAPPPAPLPGEVESAWPGGRLIELAARQHVPGVVEALEAVPPCGPNATWHLVQAFAAIDDPAAAARLVPSLVRWLSNVPGSVNDVPALSTKLILLLGAGYRSEAAQLLDALLAYKDSPGDLGPRRRAEATISDFWLKHLIKTELPKVTAADLPWLAWRLEVKFREVQEWEAAEVPELAPPAFLHSFYLLPVSELEESTAHFSELVAWGLKETLLRLTAASSDAAVPFLQRWLPERILILRRIALYVLSEHGDLLPEIVPTALRYDNFRPDERFSEFWQFLHSRFARLDEADRKQVEEWILSSTGGPDDAHLRYRWLTAISDRLSPVTAEIFRALHDRFGDEPNLGRLIAMTDAGFVEPIAPVGEAAFSQWTVGEIVRYCLHYVAPEESFDAPSKEGLARALQYEVARRPVQFSAEASMFKVFGGELRNSPRYVEAFLRGLDTAIQEGKTRGVVQEEKGGDDSPNRLVSVLEASLAADVMDLILWLDGRDGSPRERFIPVWEDTRHAAAGLLVDLLEAGLRLQPAALRDLLAQNDHSILEALAGLLRATDPDAERDSDDPLITAINSTRGRALLALIAFVRCWAVSRRTDPESKTFELHPRAMDLFAHQLAEEASPAVRCTYGWRLPFLFAIARDWLLDNLSRVLPHDEDNYRIWRATWDAYIAFNQLHEDLWAALSAEYLRATERLGERWYEGRPFGEIDRRLGSHIFLASFLELEASESVLASFLNRSDDDLRASVASFGALVIRDQIVGKGLGPESSQWLRLREYWRARLLNEGTFGQSSCGRMERVAFVRWLDHVPEPLPAITDLVQPMLDGFEPAQDWEAADLLEYLAKQGEQFPSDAVQVMLHLAGVFWPRWLTTEQEHLLLQSLRAGARDEGTRPVVEHLVGMLAERYQFFSYRSVLDGS